jgi:serine/threonine protein kinase
VATHHHSALTGPTPSNTLLKQRYRIVERLGRGGMGSVYKATDTELGHALRAVKEMSQAYANQEDLPSFSEAFKQEALLLATLQHHHLPRIYDHFHEQGRWYLVMDYIEGFNLDEYLRLKGGSLPLLEALGIGMQLCTVLDYLHTHTPPIIFRDLKPANVMRGRDGHIYLIDFGIARIFKSGQARDTSVFVSYGYAAPEQYGLVQTTPQADIYSLGATLHQLISGSDPGKMPLPWAFAPLRLSAAVSATGLNKLISSMLDVNPAQRPSSAAWVKQELQRIAMGRSTTGAPVITSRLRTPATAQQPAVQFTPQKSAVQAHVSQAARPAAQLPQASQAQQAAPPSVALVSSPQAPAPSSTHTPPVLGTVIARYEGHSGHILGIDWAPDGQRVVSVSADQTARVWHAATGQHLATFDKHTYVVQAVAWSPDGQYVASAGDNNTVQVWNATSGEPVFAYQGHTGYVTMLAWSPDGSELASGGSDRTVQIWQPATGRRRLTYRWPVGVLTALAWSPDGATVLLITRRQERNKQGNPLHKTAITVFSTTNGEDLDLPTPEALSMGTLAALAWSPDGQHIALGGSEQVIRVYRWEWGFKEPVLTLRDHMQQIRAVAWSPNGKRVASCDDSCILVWDALTGSNVDIYRGKSLSYALAWSPDGQRLAAALDGTTVQVWQAE